MSFGFNISSSNEQSGLISFRMDWLHLLAVQGTLKGLLQHHSSQASVLWCSAFFIVQLSQPYMTVGKTIVLTRQTFVGKVISLLFSMLSRLIITFLSQISIWEFTYPSDSFVVTFTETILTYCCCFSYFKSNDKLIIIIGAQFCILKVAELKSCPFSD